MADLNERVDYRLLGQMRLSLLPSSHIPINKTVFNSEKCPDLVSKLGLIEGKEYEVYCKFQLNPENTVFEIEIEHLEQKVNNSSYCQNYHRVFLDSRFFSLLRH